MKRTLFAHFAFSALLYAHSAAANPLGTYGFGSRSSALAGGVSADVDDFSANYYNPAGLVRARSPRVDFGYFYAAHQLSANGLDNNVDPAHGVVGGVSAPGRLFGLPFAFGLGVHLPDDRLSRSRALPQIQPRWELYDNRVQLLYLAANIAFAPFPWLRVGGGLSFISSTRGRLDIYGDIAYPNANLSQLRHTVDADLRAVRYPQFGMQIDVARNVTVSMVYRGSFSLALDFDAVVAGNIVIGNPRDAGATRIPGQYVLGSSSAAVFLPQQAVLGGAWKITRRLTVMGDVTWLNYSAYRNPTANLNVGLDLTLPPGTTGLMIPALPPSTQPVPANFHDTFAVRIAVESETRLGRHSLMLRAGYRYDPTPVPEQRGRETNFWDGDKHVPSVGVGFILRGLAPVISEGISFDVHAAAQLIAPRTMRKDDPTDPVGDVTIGGRVFDLGATVGLIF